ncbi:hypothetical protein BURCENBC7_AP5151 [Burkholderia cenocepacia BC7]|nr:hypothetical protein BURCENBC7_AP5151 [Burkholderia cenocepacia BC7]
MRVAAGQGRHTPARQRQSGWLRVAPHRCVHASARDRVIAR